MFDKVASVDGPVRVSVTEYRFCKDPSCAMTSTSIALSPTFKAKGLLDCPLVVTRLFTFTVELASTAVGKIVVDVIAFARTEV